MEGKMKPKKVTWTEIYERLGNILEDYPHYGLAHYGISLVLKRKKDLVNIKLNDMLTSFNNRSTPPVPNHLRDVFLDYDRLDPELQKIVLIKSTNLLNDKQFKIS